MALLTWRQLNDKGDPFGPTLFLDFEATLQEEYTRAAEVVTFPVESGALFTDHYQPQPRAITLEVFVSNTPIVEKISVDGATDSTANPGGFRGPKALDLPVNRAPVAGLAGQRLIQGNASRFPKKRTVEVLQFNGLVTRRIDVFTVLDLLMGAAQPVTILIFGEIELDNFVITNVRAPRTAADGSSQTFTIDLQQITVSDSSVTTANDDPSEPRHKPRNDKGGQQARDLQASSEEAAQLARIQANLDPSLAPPFTG